MVNCLLGPFIFTIVNFKEKTSNNPMCFIQNGFMPFNLAIAFPADVKTQTLHVLNAKCLFSQNDVLLITLMLLLLGYYDLKSQLHLKIMERDLLQFNKHYKKCCPRVTLMGKSRLDGSMVELQLHGKSHLSLNRVMGSNPAHGNS